jgi:hypothetical protein
VRLGCLAAARLDAAGPGRPLLAHPLQDASELLDGAGADGGLQGGTEEEEEEVELAQGGRGQGAAVASSGAPPPPERQILESKV